MDWFERTHLSMVRLVFFSRPLPSAMALSSPILFCFKLRKDARLTTSKTLQNQLVTHPGLLIESSGLGWFEGTHSSVVRVVLISRILARLCAPSGPILFTPRLRKDTRLTVSTNSKNVKVAPRAAV